MSKAIKVDFSGVSQEIRRGGSGSYLPPGDYAVKIVQGELRDSERSGSRYFNWQLQVTRGEFKGKSVYTNTSLKPDALWSLRNLIHAATGRNVAGKALNFDPEKLYGKEVAITTEDREYKNDSGQVKLTSNVIDVRPIDELEEESETEEEVEEETEETDDDETLEEVDVDEL